MTRSARCMWGLRIRHPLLHRPYTSVALLYLPKRAISRDAFEHFDGVAVDSCCGGRLLILWIVKSHRLSSTPVELEVMTSAKRRSGDEPHAVLIDNWLVILVLMSFQPSRSVCVM